MRQSKNLYAVHFAATMLKNILTDYTTSFSVEDRLEIRKAMLTILADYGGQYWNNNIKVILIECFCRLQKLCWFDNEATVNQIADVMPFLQHSLPHCVIGISLLQKMVHEMSQTTEKFPYSKQRKIAIVFREKCLKEIFQLGLTSLQKIISADKQAPEPTKTQNSILLKETLELISQVLSFDFIGVAPDPSSSDDVGVVHVPESWAAMIEDPETLALFFRIHDEFGPQFSHSCLVVLEGLAGIRSSIFRQEARANILNNLVDGIGAILTKQKDLDNPQNRHQMTRLLVRLKGNYQLKHIMETRNFTPLLQKVLEFSQSLFKSTEYNSIYYILNFWAYVVTSYSQPKNEKTPMRINEVAPAIINHFIVAQLEILANPPPGADELLESEHLHSILGELPNIARSGYHVVCGMLFNFLGTVLTQRFQAVLALSPQNPAQASSIEVAERLLAWIVHLCSAVIGGGNRLSEEVGKPEVQQMEARIIRALFEISWVHDKRIQEHGITKATASLELAFISFLQKFCRVYLSETEVTTSVLYEALSNLLNGGLPERLLERIVTKIIMLLKMWPDNTEIIEQTTGTDGIFWHLATGFAASKLMGKSAVVCKMLERHMELDVGGARRSREAFYKTLSCLLFSTNNKTLDFYAFIAPMKNTMEQIRTTLMNPSVQHDHAKMLLRRILSDLRGFVSAIFNKDRGFPAFFDWFYHETGYYEWLVQLLTKAPQLKLETEDAWSIILFADEFTNNSRRRISFPITSADGIRLFRTTAHLLIQFAAFLNSSQHSPEEDDKYKSIKLFLRCLDHSLTGGYTNFGVFEMYNDTILNDLLKLSCNLLFGLDSFYLEKYPKVFTLVFSVSETLTRDHCEFLISMDSNLFGKLLSLLLMGLQSKIKTVINSCCNSLDRLFSLHVGNAISFQQQTQATPPGSPIVKFFAKTQLHSQVERMTTHIANHQTLLHSILIQLINICITTEGIHWFAGKPLLALIILSQPEFTNIINVIVRSQSHDEAKAKKVSEICSHLMEGISPNLLNDNREKFTTNLTVFRNELKAIIDLNAFYKAVVGFTNE
uniref:Exportin-7/Ran-binding protein 17 TPR repeats domain-containing protein n=1 Tax=Arcella intermedia TaxID=1963864 RepID=A0A6B2KX45_9EUKA